MNNTTQDCICKVQLCKSNNACLPECQWCNGYSQPQTSEGIWDRNRVRDVVVVNTESSENVLNIMTAVSSWLARERRDVVERIKDIRRDVEFCMCNDSDCKASCDKTWNKALNKVINDLTREESNDKKR